VPTPCDRNHSKHRFSKFARAEDRCSRFRRNRYSSSLRFQISICLTRIIRRRNGGDWVSRRWVDGLKTLRLIPLRGAPRGFGNAWPAYAYEWEDLIAQQEQGELEATQPEQNRVRLQPSYRQVTMCEAVISWPILSRRSRAGLAGIQSCRLGLRMRARRDVRGVPVRRKRRDASGTLHQRLRPGRRQAARRSSTRI
jgi:hypothetical protein